jgi:hypothetical protein
MGAAAAGMWRLFFFVGSEVITMVFNGWHIRICPKIGPGNNCDLQ